MNLNTCGPYPWSRTCLGSVTGKAQGHHGYPARDIQPGPARVPRTSQEPVSSKHPSLVGGTPPPVPTTCTHPPVPTPGTYPPCTAPPLPCYMSTGPLGAAYTCKSAGLRPSTGTSGYGYGYVSVSVLGVSVGVGIGNFCTDWLKSSLNLA